MNPTERVTIVGRGAVGSALVDFFHSMGWEIFPSPFVKDGSGRYELEEVDPRHEMGELVILASPDDQIESVSQHLSELKGLKWNNRVVAHCSGAMTSDLLSDLHLLGASTVAMHPIQTFVKGDGKERFEGITISLEGEEQACGFLEPIIQQMNARSVRIDKDQKRVIHTAAVLCSNYLVSLMGVADDLLQDGGIDEGFEIMKPLIRQTVENLFTHRPKDALSGPIRRGDLNTLSLHLDYLGTSPRYENLYKVLGREAVELTRKRGDLPESVIKKMEELLS